MDKKRILIALGFLTFSVLLGWFLYRVFFAKPSEEPTTPPSTVGQSGDFPTSGEQGGIQRPSTGQPGALPTAGTIPGTTAPVSQQPSVTTGEAQLLDTAVTGATSDQLGRTKFYNRQDGKFYRLDSDGNAIAMSEQVFFNVDEVTWSPTANESILEYPDGSNIYYNFDTREQATLPKHWEEFSFAPAGNSIAAKSLGLSPENRWLVTSNPNGENIRLVEPLGNNADRVIVDWSPNQQIVALSRTGQALGADRQEVLFVGQFGENFKSTVVEGRGLETKWSPNGSKLLYSVYSARSDFKPELWVVNANSDTIGSGRKLLNVNTWAEKCTFADDRFAYCGVPISVQTGAGFAPDLSLNIQDQIYRLDTQTGLRTLIPLDQRHTIDTIFLGKDGKTLFFTDKLLFGLFSVPVN